MSLFLLGGSAIVPSLLLLWYVYARDKNPEPRGLLWRTFLWGAFICAPVVPVAQWLEGKGMRWSVGVWSAALVQAFLGAAIPEEGFKYLVLRRFVWNKPAFDEPLDGVVYGATASLGFATLENILYVGQGGMGVAVLRALTAVPQHAFTGIIMGAFVGRARFVPEPARRTRLLATGLAAAILLHGAYDAFLMTHTGWAVMALVVLGLGVRWGRRLYKELQSEQVLSVLPPVAAEPFPAPELPLPVRSAPSRPFPLGAWVKLLVSGVGLTGCGFGWLVVFFIFADPAEGGGLKVFSAVFMALPTLGLLALFRSGLRGLAAAAEDSTAPDGLDAGAHLAPPFREPRP